MIDVKDHTNGAVKAHILTLLEAEALEVRIVEVLESGVKMNNNESSLFAAILSRIEEARPHGKGPYVSVKQWTWLSDVLDKYEPAFTPAQLRAVAAAYAAEAEPEYTVDDLFRALDKVAEIQRHLQLGSRWMQQVLNAA